ncbi:MAG: glycosyltransferase family 4 protein [Chloroflexi bacterium]|nr:glycosyltransferase family 4 protein [Chloroflexota bacterium]
MIAIASCWPPDVASGSGTTVSQNRLVDALALVGVHAEVLYTSRFASTPEGLVERERANRALRFDGYDAVLGIDGEGWYWAAHQRRIPYLSFCEAVLAEVLPFEGGAIRQALAVQAHWEQAGAFAADAVVARSAFSADRVEWWYGVPPARITVLPIPMDVAAWRASLPELPKEPLVLAVGHLYPRKNVRGLVECWPRVRAAHPQAELAIVGTGPEALVPSAGVRVLGHVPFKELLALYARAHVFCHPSLQENFGIAVVEGLASGAGVVTHRQPAALESTAGLPGTWVVDAADPIQLAAALIEALAAPAPWPAERLSALEARLSPARLGAQLRGLLERVGTSLSS